MILLLWMFQELSHDNQLFQLCTVLSSCSGHRHGCLYKENTHVEATRASPPPPPPPLSLSLFLSSFTTTINPEWVSECVFVCVSRPGPKSCLCICAVMRKRVWMSVLLMDECCGGECAEGARSLQSWVVRGGLLQQSGCQGEKKATVKEFSCASHNTDESKNRQTCKSCHCLSKDTMLCEGWGV